VTNICLAVSGTTGTSLGRTPEEASEQVEADCRQEAGKTARGDRQTVPVRLAADLVHRNDDSLLVEDAQAVALLEVGLQQHLVGLERRGTLLRGEPDQVQTHRRGVVLADVYTVQRRRRTALVKNRQVVLLAVLVNRAPVQPLEGGMGGVVAGDARHSGDDSQLDQPCHSMTP
jgi:hypothetical protein